LSIGHRSSENDSMNRQCRFLPSFFYRLFDNVGSSPSFLNRSFDNICSSRSFFNRSFDNVGSSHSFCNRSFDNVSSSPSFLTDHSTGDSIRQCRFQPFTPPLWNETLYKKETMHKTEYSSAVTCRISMKKSSFKSLCSNGAS
jgi:hypothetical protein